MTSYETNISTVKEKGCNAGELFEKEYEYKIPCGLEDQSQEREPLTTRTSQVDLNTLKFGQPKTARAVHVDYDDDEKPRVNLCGSWLGELFQVEYTLRVFVKYDNFFKRG